MIQYDDVNHKGKIGKKMEGKKLFFLIVFSAYIRIGSPKFQFWGILWMWNLIPHPTHTHTAYFRGTHDTQK